MDFDNMMEGLDPQSYTGIDKSGRTAPITIPKSKKELKVTIPESKLSGFPKLKCKISELVDKSKEGKEITIFDLMCELIKLNEESELREELKSFLKTDSNWSKLSQYLFPTYSDLNKIKEVDSTELVKDKVSKLVQTGLTLEVRDGLNSEYPEGRIIYPRSIPGLNVFDIYDPKSEYPFEDFELTVTRIYDDGHQEEVQNMVLGFRGSIKGYVKVYDDSYENPLYGFKQIIRNKKGRKPAINLRVKYHNSLGGFITPIFGKTGDEKISLSEVGLRLV